MYVACDPDDEVYRLVRAGPAVLEDPLCGVVTQPPLAAFEVLAGQPSFRERTPRDNGKVEGIGHWDQVAFRCPLQHVVPRLKGDERRPTAQFRGCVGFCDLPGGPVGDTDIQHLSGTDQIIEGTHHLDDWRPCLAGVHPQQVDVFGAHAAQAGLDRPHQVLSMVAGRVEVTRPRLQRVLGADHEPIAVRPKEVTEDPPHCPRSRCSRYRGTCHRLRRTCPG